jgi:hypothetical protein
MQAYYSDIFLFDWNFYHWEKFLFIPIYSFCYEVQHACYKIAEFPVFQPLLGFVSAVVTSTPLFLYISLWCQVFLWIGGLSSFASIVTTDQITSISIILFCCCSNFLSALFLIFFWSYSTSSFYVLHWILGSPSQVSYFIGY